MTESKLLTELKTLLEDLRKQGSFFPSAIEFNPWDWSPEADGEEFAKRIDKLLIKIDTYKKK